MSNRIKDLEDEIIRLKAENEQLRRTVFKLKDDALPRCSGCGDYLDGPHHSSCGDREW